MKNIKDSTLNSCYFLSAGMITIISIQVTTMYSAMLNFFIEDCVFSILLMMNLGSIVGFFLSIYVGKEWSKSNTIAITTLIMLACMLGIFINALYFSSEVYAYYSIFLISFLCGLVNSWRRTLIIGMAAQISQISIKINTLGTAVSGIWQTIIGTFFSYFFSVGDEKDKELTASNYKNQFLSMAFFIILSFAWFFYISILWFRKHPMVNKISTEYSVERVQKSKSTIELLKKSLDINFCIIINLLITANIMSFWIVASWKKYKSFGTWTVPTFFFASSVCDMLARTIPVRFFLKKSHHFGMITCFRVLIIVYFFCIVNFEVDKFWSSELTRVFFVMISGFTGGYVIVSTLCLSRDRFHSSEERAKCSFYNVLSLLLGWFVGTLFAFFFMGEKTKKLSSFLPLDILNLIPAF